MEENKVEINNEKNEISEESLQEVAGGIELEASPCRFRPKLPYEAKHSHGAVWVKCISCERGCHCYGTVYCEGMMHMMQRDNKDPLKWRPYYALQHWDDDKIVAPLDMG